MVYAEYIHYLSISYDLLLMYYFIFLLRTLYFQWVRIISGLFRFSFGKIKVAFMINSHNIFVVHGHPIQLLDFIMAKRYALS